MTRDIKDLLTGIDNAQEIERIIKQNLKQMNCKLFIDDGVDNIYVPKNRLDAKIAQLKEANNTIDDLESKLGNIPNSNELEQAKERIKELEQKVNAHETEVKTLKISSAFEMLAKEMKAVDLEVLEKLIDLNKVEINEEGQVNGLKEQMDALAQSKSYLFGEQVNKEASNTPVFGGTGVPGKPNKDNLFGSKTAQEGDFGKLLAKNSNNNKKVDYDDSFYFANNNNEK